MEAIFAAVDISGISANVSTLIIGFIGIGLLFVARRYVGRTIKAPV